MRLETRTWFILSALLLVAAIFFWIYGNHYEAKKKIPAPIEEPTNSTPSPSAQESYPLLTTLQSLSNGGNAPLPVLAGADAGAPPDPTGSSNGNSGLRLRNTAQSFEVLAQSDSALLLRNALLDTEQPLTIRIPPHLRSEGDPGSFIIQASGPITSQFRTRLRNAGAEIVSYIPNNAYLVRLTAAAANGLATAPGIQAVLPYEPYYKIEPRLLAVAVDRKPLPDDGWLRLTLFPGQRESALTALQQLGGEVVAEEPTPFGPQLLVRPAIDTLPALARLPSVQTIEAFYRRAPANDLTRIQLGIATNGVATNYLGLSGSNVVLNVVDSGIDNQHPDLQGRIFAADPSMFTDESGHGTHVAGIIAGDGSQSATVSETPPGSGTNANFRGIAPQSQIFGFPIDFSPEVNAPVADTYLQESTALTNAVLLQRETAPVISHNSWFYTGANEYDSAAARFDAAVRDALPQMSDSQPIIYVFPAGNSGVANDDSGLGGDPNSIPSPGTAKNVITVGALEHPRFLTNGIVTTNGVVTTNMPFFELTDSADQVASFSGRGNIGIGIEGQFGRFKPDLVAPGAFVLSARSKDWEPPEPTDLSSEVLNELNEKVGPHYRYESGSSMAAAAVAGSLALLQEFFEQMLPAGSRRTNSPALMKAALINGARSAGPLYSFQVENTINYQGWGVPNLSNTIPTSLLATPESQWPIHFIDQNPTNAVGTGQSRSWNLDLSLEAQQEPLRVTLVWTDPPGNPAAGVKLVNDLDLVVSNTVTHEVFYGNDIGVSSDFNTPRATNAPPVRDVINNVENVFIRSPFASNFVVSVVGRRVNVNAVPDYRQVTGQPNDVVQDFALVISTDNSSLTNALILSRIEAPLQEPSALPAIGLTNGMPVLKQRVGAQPAALTNRHGIASQWNFYVFTNTFFTNDFASITNGTNVAFVTFSPPNLSVPRNDEADIDLYVSTDPGLLTLQPGAVDAAFKSLARGGTEFVVLTNAALDQVFYIGVKSEDHQGSEYGLVTFSSDEPFEQDDNGRKILRGFPTRAPIPDGSASDPGGVQILAIGISPNLVQRVIVTNVISHENMGDLVTILSHDRTAAVLHNHTDPNPFFGTNLFVYDDSTFAPVPNSMRSDGPGSLNDFVGQTASGVWMLNVVDNAPSHTGRVEQVTLRVEPMAGGDLAAAGAAGLDGTVGPNDFITYFHDVPPEATNLIVRLSQMSGPLEVYVRREAAPTRDEFDKADTITPPGGDVALGFNDQPEPLLAGRYFISLFNPSANSEVTFHIASLVELSPSLDSGLVLRQTNSPPVLDDALLRSSIFVRADKHISDVEVGVRISHPRISDLALWLVSPQGTRVLLSENRGGVTSSGFGAGFDTNISFTVFTEQTNQIAGLTPIKFAAPPFTNLIGGIVTPIFFDSFEGSAPGQYPSNTVVSGWSVSSGAVQLHGPGNAFGIQALTGTNFLELQPQTNSAAVLRTFDTVAGADYVLTLNYHRNPEAAAADDQELQFYVGPMTDPRPTTNSIPVIAHAWQSTNIVFRAISAQTALEISSTNTVGPLIDDIVVTSLASTFTNSFVVPEESLNLLRGERSVGEWRLEVADTRGSAGIVGVLLEWELRLKYGRPRSSAIPLKSGIPIAGSITNNQTNYFILDICEKTTVADLVLTGSIGGLTLLADRSGLPTGDRRTDDFVPLINLTAVGGGSTNGPPSTNAPPSTNLPPATNVVMTFSAPPTNPPPVALGTLQFHLESTQPHPAPLEPGRRLFFAVHNTAVDETNDYTILVTLDNDECHQVRPIIVLTNAVPFTNSIPPIPDVLDNYVFTVSSNAVGVTFDLRPVDGDLGLVLRHGLPIPDRVNFQYLSDNPGITNELIFVGPNSSPIPLQPGPWYAGVYNDGSTPVNYTIEASELVLTGLNIIPLTNGIPVDFAISLGSAPTNFFLFSVTNPAPSLRFTLSDLTGPADLLVGLNRLPPYTGSFTNSGASNMPAIIEIRPALVGDYFASVLNRGTNDLGFRLRADLDSGATNIVFIDPAVEITDTNICLTWPSLVGFTYRIEGKTNITDVSWTVLDTIIADTPTSRFCIARPTDLSFFQIVQLPQEEPPPGEPVFINPALTITATNICLAWDSTIGSIYRVEAKTNVTDAAWTVLDSITAETTNSSFCIDRPTDFQFFQVVELPVTPPPPPGEELIIDPAVTVTETNICLSWPSTNGVRYRVEGKTNITDTVWNLIDQVIGMGTNSTICISRPTDYQFFQVVEVRSTPPPPPPPPPPSGDEVFIDPLVSVTETNVCLSWPSTNGLSYRIEGRTNITDTVWNLIDQVTGMGTNSMFCIPRPTGYQFFQVVQEGATNAPPAQQEVSFAGPPVLVGGDRVQFTWNSTPGQSYEVQWSTNIAESVSWVTLTNVTASGPSVTVADPTPATNEVRFYRIRIP